jgi:hypothetical protein
MVAILIVATSSDRLFLKGVLASMARLRFTGTPILNPFRDRAQCIYSERSTVSYLFVSALGTTPLSPRDYMGLEPKKVTLMTS